MRSRRSKPATRTLVLLLVLAPVPALAWRVRVTGAPSAGPVAVDDDGNVFTAIGVAAGSYQSGIAVAKLSPAGEVRWRRRLHGAGPERSDFVDALATTPCGDVVAAGSLDDFGHATFFVARIAGQDGEVRWQRTVR